jgi:hypothetical protein
VSASGEVASPRKRVEAGFGLRVGKVFLSVDPPVGEVGVRVLVLICEALPS